MWLVEDVWDVGVVWAVGVDVINADVSARTPLALAAATVMAPSALPAGAGMSGKLGSAGCTFVRLESVVGSLVIWACRNQSFIAADVLTA